VATGLGNLMFTSRFSSSGQGRILFDFQATQGQIGNTAVTPMGRIDFSGQTVGENYLGTEVTSDATCR
jgi:hypothetical protein